MKKVNLIILTLNFLNILYTSNLITQVQQTWVRQFTESYSSTSLYISVDRHQNICVTGTGLFPYEGIDVFLVKYNTDGNQLWSRKYNDSLNGDDYPSSISIDNNDNVFISGYYLSNVGLESFVIKYDSSGNLIWTSRIPGYLSIKNRVDYFGNMIVAGVSIDSSGSRHITAIKYNPQGDQLWFKRFIRINGLSDDHVSDMVVDKSGNIIVTGYTYERWYNDYTTVKFDALGDIQWVKYYHGSTKNDDEAYAVAVDPDDNIYVTGLSYYPRFGPGSITLKYDPNGTLKWTALNDTAPAYFIMVDSKKSTYIGCLDGYNYITIKYDSAGLQQWVRFYSSGYTYQNYIRAMLLDNLDNIYITGTHRSVNPDHTSFVTIKYNSSGIQQWLQTFDHQSYINNSIRAMALDSSMNVFITGTTDDYSTTIKYSQVIGIKPINAEIPKSFSLSQNYPNPFNPSTKIKFDIPNFPLMKGVRGMNVRLTIYDLLGREVATLINQPLQPGTYEVSCWDGTNYPSGVYFYKLTVGNYTNSKKLILLK